MGIRSAQSVYGFGLVTGIWILAALSLGSCGGSDHGPAHRPTVLHVTPGVVKPGDAISTSVTGPRLGDRVLASEYTTIERRASSGQMRRYYLFAASGRKKNLRPIRVNRFAQTAVGLSLPSHKRLRIPRLASGEYRVVTKVSRRNHGSDELSAPLRVTR